MDEFADAQVWPRPGAGRDSGHGCLHVAGTSQGKPVDRRADIWAFGEVLYEMLTGKPAFDGETVTDVLAAIVTREPDWNLLPPGTPPSIRRLLRRCLERDRRRRLADAGEVRFQVEEALAMPAAGPRPLWRPPHGPGRAAPGQPYPGYSQRSLQSSPCSLRRGRCGRSARRWRATPSTSRPGLGLC